MGKKLFLAFSLTASIAAFATHCPAGEAIIGKGIGKSNTEADNAADIQIANSINSSLSVESRDFFSQAEVNRVLTDSANFSETAIGKSFLENREAVKPLKAPYKDEHGNIVSERYICKSDAAKPYLKTLRQIASELETFTQKINEDACRNINDLYHSRIKGLEGILENLGQMDKAMQRRYDSYYEKIKKECGKAGNGIFLKFDRETSELSREFAKAFAGRGKISFKDGKCTGGLEMLVEAKEQGCQRKLTYTCIINISFKGTDCRTNKNFVLSGIIKAFASSENAARQQTRAKLANADFLEFNDWVEKLKPWMEK